MRCCIIPIARQSKSTITATLPEAMVATLGEQVFIPRRRSFRRVDLPDTA